MADVIAILEQMRASSGHAETIGLSNDVILDFASRDNTLVQAIEEAGIRQGEFTSELLMMAEHDLVSHLQEDFVNFYAPATINPYVAVAARGPWIVTSHGAVVHDNGGYGMLGGGHGKKRNMFVQRILMGMNRAVGKPEEPIQGGQNSYFTMELVEYLLTLILGTKSRWEADNFH